MRKIKANPAALMTFSFLFSGNILFNLYYSSGNPIACYIISSVFLLSFAFAFAVIFRQSKNKCGKILKKVVYYILSVAAAGFLSFSVYTYTASLGSFADYYGEMHVVLFSAVSVLAAGFCGAKKDRNSVIGFACMTVFLMIVWTFAGMLGFFYTKNIVPVKMLNFNLSVGNVMEIMKTTVILSADIIFLLAVSEKCGNVSKENNIKSNVVYGVMLYIVLCGINLLKNVLMFGEEFLSGLENPDLAAIRLVPMFELPEISVIVNTLAVTLRALVYIRVFYETFFEKNQRCDVM